MINTYRNCTAQRTSHKKYGGYVSYFKLMKKFGVEYAKVKDVLSGKEKFFLITSIIFQFIFKPLKSLYSSTTRYNCDYRKNDKFVVDNNLNHGFIDEIEVLNFKKRITHYFLKIPIFIWTYNKHTQEDLIEITK
jgi:hypothetical protein